MDLKEIWKKPKDILKKPSEFVLPIHTSESLSKNTEVTDVQIHQQQNSCDDISSDDNRLIQKVMTIKDITDLETTPEGILVEDLGSDYDDDMYMHSERRDRESSRDSQKFCFEHCNNLLNNLEQYNLEDSAKKDFYWGDTFTNLT